MKQVNGKEEMTAMMRQPLEEAPRKRSRHKQNSCTWILSWRSFGLGLLASTMARTGGCHGLLQSTHARLPYTAPAFSPRRLGKHRASPSFPLRWRWETRADICVIRTYSHYLMTSLARKQASDPKRQCHSRFTCTSSHTVQVAGVGGSVD